MNPGDVRVQAFLRRSMNMRVATLSTHGVPHITPLRFLYDGRSIYAITRMVTLVARHVRSQPNVVLLFDAEGRAGPALRIRANAVLRNDPELPSWMKRQAVTKYFLRPGGIWNLLKHWRRLPAWTQERSGSTAEKRALIEFVPVAAEFLSVRP